MQPCQLSAFLQVTSARSCPHLPTLKWPILLIRPTQLKDASCTCPASVTLTTLALLHYSTSYSFVPPCQPGPMFSSSLEQQHRNVIQALDLGKWPRNLKSPLFKCLMPWLVSMWTRIACFAHRCVSSVIRCLLGGGWEDKRVNEQRGRQRNELKTEQA